MASKDTIIYYRVKPPKNENRVSPVCLSLKKGASKAMHGRPYSRLVLTLALSTQHHDRTDAPAAANKAGNRRRGSSVPVYTDRLMFPVSEMTYCSGFLKCQIIPECIPQGKVGKDCKGIYSFGRNQGC